MLHKWWQPLPKETKIEDMLQIVGILPNNEKNTLVLKSGHLATVFQVSGKDYTGLDEASMELLHKIRNEAIRHLPSNIIATTHSRRIKESIDDSLGMHQIETAAEINRIWNTQYKHSYRNKHYVVLTTTDAGVLDELAVLNSIKGDKTQRVSVILNEAAQDFRSRLKDYNLRRLAGNDLVSFVASYLNGREVNQKYIELFDDFLTGADLVFNDKLSFQIFDGSETRYASWIGIKAYEDNTTIKLLDEILRLQSEFSIFCQFQTLSPDRALFVLDDKHRTAQSWMRYSADTNAEFSEIIQRIQNKEVALCYAAFTIQVLASSPDQLEARIAELTAIVEYYGYRAIREKQNTELVFWSMLPGLEQLMTRKRYLTSENIADIASFATVGEGVERCSWGDAPITQFFTSANTVYNFCFHVSEGDKELGHTLVFGGSNSGKTTLIDFLISQALKFSELRVILFDRLFGQRVFCEMHDASYADFGSEVQINPFLLPDTAECRTFLSQMIADMVGNSEPNQAIEYAIELIYSQLRKEERSLDAGITAFAPMSESETDLNKLLIPFTSRGKYGRFFNASRDNLDFAHSRITAFNMDALIDDPKILGLMLNYIFFRIRLMASPREGNDPKPHLIFADEFPKLLESDAFARRAKEMVLEARKLDGVFIAAAQTPQAVTNHPIGKSILNSFANFIFFPDPLADTNTLSQDYQLTSTEIDWIKRSGEIRKILFKRNGGESVILNIDLSPLGDYLRCFTSSSKEVQKLHNIKKTNHNNWKKEYLNAN